MSHSMRSLQYVIRQQRRVQSSLVPNGLDIGRSRIHQRRVGARMSNWPYTVACVISFGQESSKNYWCHPLAYRVKEATTMAFVIKPAHSDDLLAILALLEMSKHHK